MKKIRSFILILLTAIAMPTIAHAQSNAPQRFTLEAVLVDNGGNVLYDLQEADLKIWITDGSGETLYEETQHVMVSSGAMSVMVGDGNDSTGAATGGVPYDAMTPDGEKRLNFQIVGDSIPQEELELGSVPYSYYSQYAIDLPTDTVTTDHILNGTITQDDFSQELIDYIDSSMTGISEQDLINHQNEDGAHTARSVSLENTFVNISGTNVQEAFENVDHALNIRTTDIDSIETDVTDLQTQITQEISDRQAGDEALDARVGTLESTATSLQNQITQEISDRQATDQTLQTNIDNETSARQSADTTLQQNIDNEATTRSTADSSLQTQVTTAQTTADNAQTSANAAQSTANSAATAASNAQSSANAAQADVDALETTVSGHTTTLADHETRITVLEGIDTSNPSYESVEITSDAPSTPDSNTIYKDNVTVAWAKVDASAVTTTDCDASSGSTAGLLGDFNIKCIEEAPSAYPYNNYYKLQFATSPGTAGVDVDSYAVTGNGINSDGIFIIYETKGDYIIVNMRDPAGGSSTSDFMLTVVGWQ